MTHVYVYIYRYRGLFKNCWQAARFRPHMTHLLSFLQRNNPNNPNNPKKQDNSSNPDNSDNSDNSGEGEGSEYWLDESFAVRGPLTLITLCDNLDNPM